MTVLCPAPTAISNPPFIHWQGSDDAAAYRIELAGDGAEFRWETRRNFLTPADPIQAGAYTLRIRALGGDGGELASSEALRVVIEENAAPPPSDLNRIECHAVESLFGSASELAWIRDADGDTAAYRNALVACARELLGALQGELREPVRYADFVWDFETWDRGNQTCFAIEDAILATTLAWLLTGEAGFAAEARRMMCGVAAWDPRGATGVWENDHSAQALLHALALGYSTLKGLMPEGERVAVQGAIRMRCEDAYGYQNPFAPKDLSCGPMGDPDNNHPWFVSSALGLGALALAGEDPRAGEWACFAAQMFWGVYLPRGDRGGGWHEGIDYWSYTLFFVFQFADGLRRATGTDLYRHPWLRNTATFKILTHPPEGGYVPFGDCKHHSPNAFDKLIMMRLAQELASPMLWRYVDAITDPISSARCLAHAVSWSARGGARQDSQATLPEVACFGEIGWVVANTNPFDEANQLLFAFRSGGDAGRKAAHSHADQNSFVLCAGGDRLLWDAGYYDSYLSEHHRDYSRLSAAHNVILVDGRGQAVCEPGIRGRIVRFEHDGRNPTVVVGDASDPSVYEGRLLRFVRTIQLDLGGRLDLCDDIAVPHPAVISFLLHSAHPIEFDAGSGRIAVAGPHRRIVGEFVAGSAVVAAVTRRFPVAPTARLNRVLDGAAEYAEQWHLEIRTAGRVVQWRPRLTLRVLPA